jgi:tetratricopeptide (TPR) repeat protein
MNGGDPDALRQFIDAGWARHDRESERLARELEEVAGAAVRDELLAPFVHLATHAIGEHLGDWRRALALGNRVLAERTPTSETANAWGRVHVAAVLANASVEAVDLELSCLKACGGDPAATLLDMRFMLIGALVGSKRIDEAGRLYRGALEMVGQIGASSSLDRQIAATSNNLGWELYEMSSRSDAEDALMALCAETGVAFWLKCGNWVNEERALYLRALVSNARGNPEAALADVDKALAVIAANGERPLDGALLHLARASALGALGDAGGASKAIADADAAASRLAAPELRAQFEKVRAATVAAS